MTADNNVRRRILDSALDIVEAQGIKALTQPKIAKATGLRQSHLTYYFPRKADLLAALLDASHDRAAKKRQARPTSDDPASIFEQLANLMFDRPRMQFFLGLAAATSDEPELGSRSPPMRTRSFGARPLASGGRKATQPFKPSSICYAAWAFEWCWSPITWTRKRSISRRSPRVLVYAR